MRSRTAMVTTRAAALLAAAAVTLSGCGGSDADSAPQPGSLLPPVSGSSTAPSNPATAPSSAVAPSSAPATPRRTSPPAAAPPAPPPATAAPAGRGAPPGTLPGCVAADLSLSLGQGNAGAGTAGYPLVFSNVGARTCTMTGFPGASFVAGDAGDQVGAAAERVGPDSGTVTLDPGGLASALVLVTQVRSYPQAQCRPTPVRGFRIYPPNDTAAMFVAEPDTGCADASVPVLRIQSVVPGSSGGA